jgi:diadenosine tetraphosphate (Ap4A) HIT family hydrolase
MVIRDGYPISPGHTLIIPKRHTGSFFDTTTEERNALLELLDWAKADLTTPTVGALLAAPTNAPPLPKPDAFNIGINDGPAAGQTVPHLHIHLIPRYQGDMPDPRGGVRWIMPEKADYWSKPK